MSIKFSEELQRHIHSQKRKNPYKNHDDENSKKMNF